MPFAEAVLDRRSSFHLLPLHFKRPGWTEACDRADQRYVLLCQGVGVHQPKELLPPLLVQLGRDLLTHGFELLSLLIAWLGVESIFQCPHVVVHGASLLCSGTPYHTLVGIATGSGENYQFRHIFFRSVLVGVHFAGSVGDAVLLKSFSQGEPAPSASPGTLPAPAYYDPRKVAQVPHG